MTPQFAAYLGDMATAQGPAQRLSSACLSAQQQLARTHEAARGARRGQGPSLSQGSSSRLHGGRDVFAQGEAARRHGSGARVEGSGHAYRDMPAEAERAPIPWPYKAQRLRWQQQQHCAAPLPAALGSSGRVSLQAERTVQERCSSPDPGLLPESSSSPASMDSRPGSPAGDPDRVRLHMQCCF